MFHKEGGKIILISTSLTILILLISRQFISIKWVEMSVQIATVLLLIIVLQFFRNPNRTIVANSNTIVAPVDGKVVVIEEVLNPNILKTNVCKFPFSCRPLTYT